MRRFVLVLLAVLCALLAQTAFAQEGGLYLPEVLAPGAGTVAFLPGHTAYTDILNSVHLVGEVQNNMAVNARFVKVTGRLVNSSGEEVASAFQYTWYRVLPPGERTCFHIIVSPAPPPWASYRLELTASQGGAAAPNMAVSDLNGFYNALDWYEIDGLVRNGGQQMADSARAVGTLYNEQGMVIGCDSDPFLGNDLPAGESTPFELTFTNVTRNQPVTHRVQAYANVPE